MQPMPTSIIAQEAGSGTADSVPMSEISMESKADVRSTCVTAGPEKMNVNRPFAQFAVWAPVSQAEPAGTAKAASWAPVKVSVEASEKVNSMLLKKSNE